jgi:hypothetical protein
MVSEVQCMLAQPKEMPKEKGLNIICLKELESINEDFISLATPFADESPLTRFIGMSLVEVMHGQHLREPLDLLSPLHMLGHLSQ